VLQGPVFTLIHVLISSDLTIQFILRPEGAVMQRTKRNRFHLPNEVINEKMRSTYACDAGAHCKY